MQGCKHFEGALYEGHITPDVLDHFAECGACRDLAARLNRLDQAAHFDVDIDPQYAAFRRRLILQKLATVQPESRYVWAMRLARVALVALFAFILFLPYHASQNQTASPAGRSMAAIDFELIKNGNIVELRWRGDPHHEYRVYKGANPGQLAAVQQVKGVAWIDRKPDSSPILFYKIEAL